MLSIRYRASSPCGVVCSVIGFDTAPVVVASDVYLLALGTEIASILSSRT